MFSSNSLRIAIIVGTLSAFCGAAVAQGKMQSGGNRGSGAGRMMMNGPMMGFNSEGMLDRIDGRLAFIKTELGIRADQNKQWDDLAVEVRESAEVHNGMMRSMMETMHDGDSSALILPAIGMGPGMGAGMGRMMR